MILQSQLRESDLFKKNFLFYHMHLFDYDLRLIISICFFYKIFLIYKFTKSAVHYSI